MYNIFIHQFLKGEIMKRVINEKTNAKTVVFNKYELKDSTSCPECGRFLDEHDLKLLNEMGKRSCVKCGAILVK